MNYKEEYDRIIENAKSSIRRKGIGIYFEKHHIKPRCIGGTDRKDNLVLLTAREHFICHKLLTEIYSDSIKLFYAYWMMSNAKRYDGLISSPEEYEQLKIKMSVLSAKRNKDNWNDKRRKKHSKMMKDRYSDPKEREMVSIKNREYWDHNYVAKKRQSEIVKKRFKEHPEQFKNFIESSIEFSKAEENRERARQRANDLWSDPMHRAIVLNKQAVRWSNGAERDKHSQRMKQMYIDHPEKKLKCLTNKMVEVDGIVYDSMKKAYKHLKMSDNTLRFRLNSDRYPNYRYIKDGGN